jgi:hypothetical protein
LLAPDQVSAVLVTRGDVDMTPVVESLPFDDVVVWDNSEQGDACVYGRYAAIYEAKHPVIYVQDDDCVLAPESIETLLAAYEPGKIVANMPERFRPHYPDSCLVGFGALFDRALPEASFKRFRLTSGTGWLSDGFTRTCDVVFTALTPRVLVDVPYEDREFASAPNRMWKQPGHHGERVRMLDLARQVRDRVAA